MLRGGAAFALLCSAAAWCGETITTGYDARGRLVAVGRTGSINNGVVANYCYDKADNRSQVAVSSGACVAAASASSFVIGDASASEGGTVVFTVTRYGDSGASQSVNYATASGTAISGTDFTAGTGTVSFAAGETAKTISVATLQDGSIEGTETFVVNLSGATGGAGISDAQAVGTIVDDEAPLPAAFSVSDASVTEGGNLVFTVTKSGSASSSVSVSYASAYNSATAGSDYTSVSGTLTFAPTDSSMTVSVATIDDSVVESTETMTMNLSAPTSGATIVDGQGYGSIIDNDVTPTGISVSDAGTGEGSTMVFTLTRGGPTSSAVSVNYATATGTAGAGDFTAKSGTVTFAIGETSKTVTVQTTQDVRVEGDESFYLNLSNATGGVPILDAQGVGTIYDDDGGDPCPNCIIQGPQPGTELSAPEEVPPVEPPPGGGL